MAEIITETILPGTYIQVNAEGLLTVGAIATGNVGIIGTAERGSDEIQILSGFEDARAFFGEMGSWDAAHPDSNLALVRSLKLLFDNGAGTIYAKRVFAPADDGPSGAKAPTYATYALASDSNSPAMTLRAKTAGGWGARIQVRVEPADDAGQVIDEKVVRSNGNFSLSATNVDPGDGNLVTVVDQGLLARYALVTTAPSATTAQLNPTTRTFSFATAPSASADVRASYHVPVAGLRKVTIRYGNVREEYVTPSVSYLKQLLTSPDNPSQLVEVVQQPGDGLPKITASGYEAFSGGDNGEAVAANFQDSLDSLIDKPIQLLVVAGKTFAEVKAAILGHVERTENLGHERIAIVGADANDLNKVTANANAVADKRVVLVAPGIKQVDPATGRTVTLPPSFAAAAVAGKLASLSPHVSVTNKTLAGIDDLARNYSTGELKTLVQNRVLVLQTKLGARVVKGISTDDQAFKQISLRRIIDYVKEGTRQGANQYIGLLNNARVRENLRTTLDGFLADLLLREFLTGYKLSVTADRAMEIRGEVLVVMDLNPTFSIDVIRVVMNLS